MSLLKSIGIDSLIGGPLIAAATAQGQLTNQTLDFLTTVCMQRSADDSTRWESVSMDFTYSSNNETKLLSVPLLCILKLPNLSIKTVDVDFVLEIDQVTDNSEVITSDVSNNTTSSYTQSTAILGKLSSSKQSDRSTNTSASISVKIHAEDSGPTEGLSRILDVFNDLISQS